MADREIYFFCHKKTNLLSNQKEGTCMAFQPDIIVIGAGASGLAAAVAAAECGASVLVLEANRKPGTKLLRTGNGKCNLTNKGNSGKAYRGNDPAFAEKVLSRFPVSDTLLFFQSIGIPVIERDGWVYPRSEEARSVLSALLKKAEKLGVRMKFGEPVLHLQKKNGGYEALTEGWRYYAKKLILACGSCASLTTADAFSTDPYHFPGYRMARELGMEIVPVYPALTGIRLGKNFPKDWAGVRVMAELTLFVSGQKIFSESGQVQLTDYGISGIPAFILSSFISRGIAAGESCEVSMRLLPDLTETELQALLDRQKAALGSEDPSLLLGGVLPEKLIPAFVKGLPNRNVTEAAAQKMQQWKFTAAGTLELSRSQVASGGISTSDMDAVTLESRKNPGLFVTGECLDIDGVCGGWNLQFAWSSGILAGRAAARRQ